MKHSKKHIKRNNKRTKKIGGAGLFGNMFSKKNPDKPNGVYSSENVEVGDKEKPTDTMGDIQIGKQSEAIVTSEKPEEIKTGQQSMQDYLSERNRLSNEALARTREKRSIMFITSTLSTAAQSVPVVGFLSVALKFIYEIAKANTNDVKFQEFIYNAMVILTNCYNIFKLINHSSDVFMIAIHNQDGLNKLYNMKKPTNINGGDSSSVDTVETSDVENNNYLVEFQKQLDIANGNKGQNQSNGSKNIESNPHYLLYNIYQSNEIKLQVKNEITDLMNIILQSAPDTVILTLFLDDTIKKSELGNLVLAECKSRRIIKKNPDESDGYCLNKENGGDLIELEKARNNELEVLKVKGDFAAKLGIKKLASKVSKLSTAEGRSEITEGFKSLFTRNSKDTKESITQDKKPQLYEKFSQGLSSIRGFIQNKQKYLTNLSDAGEKLSDAVTELTIINGLFNVMKSQYDEVMKYYEKHLDNILQSKILGTSENNISIPKQVKLRYREQGKESPLTIFEMANYLIESSEEYRNFLVPPDLQKEVEKVANEASIEDLKVVTEDVANERAESMVDNIIEEQVDENEVRTPESSTQSTGGKRYTIKKHRRKNHKKYHKKSSKKI